MRTIHEVPYIYICAIDPIKKSFSLTQRAGNSQTCVTQKYFSVRLQRTLEAYLKALSWEVLLVLGRRPKLINNGDQHFPTSLQVKTGEKPLSLLGKAKETRFSLLMQHHRCKIETTHRTLIKNHPCWHKTIIQKGGFNSVSLPLSLPVQQESRNTILRAQSRPFLIREMSFLAFMQTQTANLRHPLFFLPTPFSPARSCSNPHPPSIPPPLSPDLLSKSHSSGGGGVLHVCYCHKTGWWLFLSATLQKGMKKGEKQNRGKVAY